MAKLKAADIETPVEDAAKPADAPAPKPEMVNAVFFPAYPAAEAYLKQKGIAYLLADGKTMKTRVKATVPRADFEATLKAHKGCAMLAA